MYRRFGSAVTIIQHGPQLVPREDEDIAIAIREILEDEGIAVLTDADATRVERRGGEIARERSATARSWAPTCWSRPAGGPTPTTSGWTRRASRLTSAATSRSTASCARASPASGRWATATAAAPSPTPPTTTSRSSRRTCSSGGERRVEDRIPTYGLFIDPPLGRAGMSEKEVRAKGLERAGREDADGGRRPRLRAQRDQGLHEDHRRRATASSCSARRCSASRATRSSRACST